jgi:hypothetical protein
MGPEHLRAADSIEIGIGYFLTVVGKTPDNTFWYAYS